MSTKSLTLGIIPARWGSTRFPGKPLAPIAGRPLIEWTYRNAKRCSDLSELVVATDNQRIFDYVKGFGGEAVMTPEDCPTGTDRLAAVLEADPRFKDYELIVNVQGDEPCLPPSTISQLINLLRDDPDCAMATAAIPFQSEEDFASPSCVKCVVDQYHNALFFSRACPVSFTPDLAKGPIYHHLGIYAFRRDFLLNYATLAPTPLQEGESLEQFRVLEHGERIKVALVQEPAMGVDTPEDVKRVETILCQQNTSLSPAASAHP